MEVIDPSSGKKLYTCFDLSLEECQQLVESSTICEIITQNKKNWRTHYFLKSEQENYLIMDGGGGTLYPSIEDYASAMEFSKKHLDLHGKKPKVSLPVKFPFITPAMQRIEVTQ